MHKQRLFITVGAAIGIISAFLAWISISFLGRSVSFSGISSDAGSGGFITLGLSAAAIAIVMTQGDRSKELDAKLKKAVAGIGGAIILYMLYYMFIRMEGNIGFLGIGGWLTLLAGIGILAVPFVIKGDGGFEMPNKDTIKADLEGTDDDSKTEEI